MHHDVLGDYPPSQVYYDPIENEYDCCKEYDSDAPGEAPNDYDDDDTISWGADDVGVGQLGDDQVLSARALSPDIEIANNWHFSLIAHDPKSPENFIAKVHCILYMYFGYMSIIPVPPFQNPVLKSETDMHRFVLGIPWESLTLSAFKTDQISAMATSIKQLHTKGSFIPLDVWHVYRENCQSIFFSACLKAVCCFEAPENLFMFDFNEHSTVK